MDLMGSAVEEGESDGECSKDAFEEDVDRDSDGEGDGVHDGDTDIEHEGSSVGSEDSDPNDCDDLPPLPDVPLFARRSKRRLGKGVLALSTETQRSTMRAGNSPFFLHYRCHAIMFACHLPSQVLASNIQCRSHIQLHFSK